MHEMGEGDEWSMAIVVSVGGWLQSLVVRASTATGIVREKAGGMAVMATMITTFEGWTFVITALLVALGFYYLGRVHGRAK